MRKYHQFNNNQRKEQYGNYHNNLEDQIRDLRLKNQEYENKIRMLENNAKKLKQDADNKENKINILEKKNDKLNSDRQSYENSLNNLKNENKKLNSDLISKNSEINKLNEDKNSNLMEINKLKSQIKKIEECDKDGFVEKYLDSEKENEKLKNKIKEMKNNYIINITKGESQIKNYNYELNQDLKEARDTISNLKNEIEKLKNKKNEELQIYKKNDYNEEYIGKELENFYDIIISIKSIKALSNKAEGWPIKWNKNYGDLKKFLDANEKLLKVGILGNGNMGKSFLLSRIFNEKIPSGYSVITEGLSIKINQEKFYALFDSAGLQTPLLKIDENQEQSVDNEEEHKKYENLYKDKTQTENFIQNLIINLSDMLLIVVGKITFNEQRLINKIKNELVNFNNNSNSQNQNSRPKKQQIFIIHNLLNFQTKKQVKEHIENTLLKSASFNLKEVFDIQKNDKKNEKRTYLMENFYDITIYHLIMAREATEAGNYYNNYTYDFLKERFNDFPQRTPLSILDEIKNKFAEWSNDLLEEKINSDNVVIQKEKEKGKEIKFIYEKPKNDENSNNEQKVDIIPKACLCDELGLSIYRSSGYEPSYACFVEDEQKLVIKMELSGKVSIEDAYADLSQNQIIIKGNKANDLEEEKKDKESGEENTIKQSNKKILKNTRKYGKFKLLIPYGNEIKLADEDPLNENENKDEKDSGIKIIKFKLARRRATRK